MPCDSMSGYDSGHSALNETRELRQQFKALKTEVDQVTALLCEACQNQLAGGFILPPKLAEWFAAHQAYDRAQGR